MSQMDNMMLEAMREDALRQQLFKSKRMIWVTLTNQNLNVRVNIEVFQNDSEVEPNEFRDYLQVLTENNYLIDHKSCEMIADEIFLEIRKKYGSNREVHIEVSQDGENGCVVTFPKA